MTSAVTEWQLASEMSNMTKCLHAQQDWSKELNTLLKYVYIFLKDKTSIQLHSTLTQMYW